MFNLASSFTSKSKSIWHNIKVDVHSHILPGLDDGPSTIDESVELIIGLYKLGFKKLIITPHIMHDFYPNTYEIISNQITLLREILKKEAIKIDLEMGAEYYLDESFIDRLIRKEKLITLGSYKNYLLFETSFVERIPLLLQAISLLKSNNYEPVLAHPERYIYLMNEPDSYERLRNLGVHFQLNINSLSNFHSKQSQETAEYLIRHDIVSFLGTDLHKATEIELLNASMSLPHYQMALASRILLNNKFYAEV